MTVALLANIILSAAVFATVVGLIVWSIATQRGDRRHVFVRRARRPQRVTAPPRFSGTPSRSQAWPAS